MAYVWQISVVNYANINYVSGVVLDGKSSSKNISRTKSYKMVLGSYFKKPFAEQELNISWGSETVQTKTNKYGAFVFEVQGKIDKEIKVVAVNDKKPLMILQAYPIYFQQSNSKVSIISDIDDTILVSYTSNSWKRITTLFRQVENRVVINFTEQILRTVHKSNGDVFYVSKSESNLFGLISSFILNNKLPQGKLFLTHYLRYRQILNPKKGKDYKEKTIRKIFENSPDKKFILMGDDTQMDMKVYYAIAQLYPDHVLKIYIRKTRKNLFGFKEELLNKMRGLNVPFLYFSDTDSIDKEVKYIKHQIDKTL